jgi:hypothetical protein
MSSPLYAFQKNSPTPALAGEEDEEEANLADGVYFSS